MRFEDALDALDLDEVVATADGADLIVVRGGFAIPDPTCEDGGVGGEEAAVLFDMVELVVPVMAGNELPLAGQAVAGAAAKESSETFGEQRFAVRSCHGNLARAFEEEAACVRFERVETARNLACLERGCVEPHAAVDVVADRFGKHSAVSLEYGSYGNAGTFVEVGRDGDLLDMVAILI